MVVLRLVSEPLVRVGGAARIIDEGRRVRVPWVRW